MERGEREGKGRGGGGREEKGKGGVGRARRGERGGVGREGGRGRERERESSTILSSCPPRRAVLVFQSTMNLGLSACMTKATH